MSLARTASSERLAMTAPDLAQVLEAEGKQILQRFVAEVERKELSPPGVSRSLLVDHIPRFLDEIRDELARLSHVRASQDALDTSPTARDHGEQRFNLGYDLEALIREYGILRRCILDVARERHAALTIDDFDILAKCLSVGVAEAASEYIKYRDQERDAQRANLEFLTEAGKVLSASLDYPSTLGRLLGLLVPRMADYCAIRLDGVSPERMPIAHVDPTKIEVVREIQRRFPLPASSPWGYSRVARTGEPVLVTDIDVSTDPSFVELYAKDPEYERLMRIVAPCSWVIVPLRVQGAMFGALILAFGESKRHYREEDLALVNEFAGRAAAAIDNARLYDLSQKERSRVEAATRAKDEFVAMVSHELRTPLNAILGWLQLVRGDTLPLERREHALDVIERNAKAQSRLVSDLLDISRVMTGKLRIVPSQVDLADVIEIAVEGIRPAAQAKRIRIEEFIERDGSVLRGDGERLQQVVWNLLVNAVKYTPKDGAIRVRLARIASDVHFVVEDSGEGISAEFLPHVFESFRQSEGGYARSHGGLGVGLSIAKHIVELHGGAIRAQSDGPGHGASFLVRLPVSPLVSTTLGVRKATAQAKQPIEVSLPDALEGIRILVVDDEPDARELVSYVLEKAGAEVQVASGVAEALQTLAGFKPDLVVSDIGMQEQDGYSFVRAIRTHDDEEMRSVPALALAAAGGHDDRTKALVAGFNRFMAKPVEPAVLVRAARELTAHARRGG